MSRYRCDCGDTECPSCGTAQGTYSPPGMDEDFPSMCEVCGLPREQDEDGGTLYICATCCKDIKRTLQAQQE